jgi:lysophospholipase L1-like esterase
LVLLLLVLCAGVASGSSGAAPRDAGVAFAAQATRPTPSVAGATTVTPGAVTVPTALSPDAPLEDPLAVLPAPTRPSVAVPEPERHVAFAAPAGSTAVFLGDSFSSGWNGAGLGARGWPRLVGAAVGWRTVNLAVPGTGFINPGWTSQPIGSRVGEAVRHEPDVIVIAAGHNDSRWSASATAKAADEVIDRLHAASPDALFVIVAPIWQDGNPPQRCLALRDHLRRKAASIDAAFIDPLADGWFSGPGHRLIGPDGLHPSNAGHQFIADRVLAGLGGG